MENLLCLARIFAEILKRTSQGYGTVGNNMCTHHRDNVILCRVVPSRTSTWIPGVDSRYLFVLWGAASINKFYLFALSILGLAYFNCGK